MKAEVPGITHMNKKNIFVRSVPFILALAALAVAFMNADFRISPYVSVSEAKSGDELQFIGSRPSTVRSSGGCTRFTLYGDDGVPIDVEYCRALPANFNHAQQIVVAGVYDPAAGLFRAERLLFKCPSKYER